MTLIFVDDTLPTTAERSLNEDRRLTARVMFDPNDYYDGCFEFLPNCDMVGFRDGL